MAQTQALETHRSRLSFSDVLEALRKQLLYIDPDDISLVYIDGYAVKVYTKSGVRIVLNGESLEVFSIESLAEAIHSVSVLALDRDD